MKRIIVANANKPTDSIRTYRNNRNPNKYIEVKKGNDGHSYMRQYMKWDTDNGEVKNYMGARTSRGRYFRSRQATIDQALEDYTEVTSGKDITASSSATSGCSFDFTWEDDYDMQEIESAVVRAFESQGLDVIGTDFYSVDYSMYPGYDDYNISQCGVDFTWTDDYDSSALQEAIESEMAALGHEVIGMDFYSLY